MAKNNNWQTKNLGEVCDFTRGLTYAKNDEADISENIVLRATNINVNTNALDVSELKYIRNSFPVPANKKVHKNALLICTASGSKSHLGKVALIDKNYNYAFGGFMGQITPKKIINAKYLFYVLTSETYKDFINELSGGVNINNLKWDDLKTFEISFPSFATQHHIAKKLDNLFTSIEKAKQNTENNLNNARELFDSYLQSVFTNPKKGSDDKRLEEVCEISSKLVDPRKPEYINLLHIGAGNIVSKNEELVDVKTAKEERLISGKFLFDKRMVLYSKIRPYLMKVVRPSFKGLCSADIYPLLPCKDLILRDYLYYLLLSPEFTEYAIKGSARAGMPKVNREHLFGFSLSLPPLPQQRFVVAKLDSLSRATKRLEVIYKQKLTDLDELKRVVLKKAFAGEL